MLKIKYELDDMIIEASGSTKDLANDGIVVIKKIYDSLMENNPLAGMLFREYIVHTLGDQDSSVWVYNYKK